MSKLVQSLTESEDYAKELESALNQLIWADQGQHMFPNGVSTTVEVSQQYDESPFRLEVTLWDESMEQVLHKWARAYPRSGMTFRAKQDAKKLLRSYLRLARQLSNVTDSAALGSIKW